MGYIKKVLWELRLMSGGSILKNLRQLEQWQWLNHEQMLSLQKERLKNLLSHAYRHVPYYHKVLYNAGVVNSSGIVNLDNFNQIPLLNKATIRLHFEDLKSDDLASRRYYENSSGGSTGEPVKLIQDKDYHVWLTASKMLYDNWTGYQVSDRKILLWGSERDLFIGHETFKKRVSLWLTNVILLNAFRMTPAQMRAYVQKINAFKPVQILAYVESIFELSRFIERERLKVHNPRAIMTSAGTLHANMRNTIERVFKSPVFNRYGSREVGDIASECNQHKGLHVSPLTHYLEIIRPDGTLAEPGEMGEIVVTLLTNYAMPLVRYRIGDIGVRSDEPCMCDRSWPLLKEVAGRVSDNFLTKDGEILYGAFFTTLFFFQDWIKKYQIIQEDHDLIRVLVVPYEQIKKSRESHVQVIREITEKIRLVMGKDCHVEWEFMDDIAPTPSGKYRFTISKVRN